jgi:hypothetical protein
MQKREINIQTGEETIIDLTPEEVSAKEAREVEVQAKRNHYTTKRKAEYPDAIECVHALLDGGDTLTELQAKRTAIKEKYPKE